MDENEKRIWNNKSTESSSFGVGKRLNHDSTKFYNSKMYGTQPSTIQKCELEENDFPINITNKILCKSSENMSEIPNNSVHLMITSPPYNAGKEYDSNLTIPEYRLMLTSVFKETFRVLVPGGRLCINIANLGRKPYIPLHSFIIADLTSIGFLMRGEVIWNKASSASQSFAWGSWQSATNPVLRDIHEYILIFSKYSYSRKKPVLYDSTISKEEFMDYTKSIWTFAAERAKQIGHPAPFPLELPYRLIQLYSFENDVILDPFVGSGTTCISSLMTKRRYIAYENNKNYCSLAEKRIIEFKQRQTTLF